MKNIFYFLVITLLTASCQNGQQPAFTGETPASEAAPVGTIPDESIYNLTDTFLTQENKQVQLRDFGGKPVVACMIFTHCDYACPRLVADVKTIEEKMNKQAEDIHFVLISFDPERDDPERLQQFKNDMKLDKNFTLLHGSEDAVRTLSVLLNIQYQQNANGDFSHSNVISVLDKNGKLVFQKEGIQANHEETISQLQKLTL